MKVLLFIIVFELAILIFIGLGVNLIYVLNQVHNLSGGAR